MYCHCWMSQYGRSFESVDIPGGFGTGVTLFQTRRADHRSWQDDFTDPKLSTCKACAHRKCVMRANPLNHRLGQWQLLSNVNLMNLLYDCHSKSLYCNLPTQPCRQGNRVRSRLLKIAGLRNRGGLEQRSHQTEMPRLPKPTGPENLMTPFAPSCPETKLTRVGGKPT
jgi:hypothetical protein